MARRRKGSFLKTALWVVGGYEVAAYLWNNYSVNSQNASLPILPLDSIGALIGYPTIFPSLSGVSGRTIEGTRGD
jgi:hypothetical protein